MRKTTLQLLLFFALTAMAQVPDNVPSPNAAALGRYGDVPVSLHTGQPHISIPLYTFNVRGVELPLSIDYDASGIKMTTLPTWTGYNWSLHAGGCITRVVNGIADEFEYPYDAHRPYPFTNYFKGGNKRVAEFATKGQTDELRDALLADSYDLEPDMFYFNFMGHSGRFFLGNEGRWKIVCDENIDVIYDASDTTQLIAPFIDKYPKSTANQREQARTIPGFKLRDANGTIYEFGYTTNAIEYSISFHSITDNEWVNSWIADAWYLTSVKDRFGNVLYSFTYERGKFFAQFYTTAQWESYKEKFSAFGAKTTAEYGYISYISTSIPTNAALRYDGTLNAPVYLTRIDAASGVAAIFDTSRNPQPLGSFYRKAVAGCGGESAFFTQYGRKIDNRIDNLGGRYYYLTNSQFSQYWANGYNQGDLHDLFTRMELRKLDRVRVTGGGHVLYFSLDYDLADRMMLKSVRASSGIASAWKYDMTYRNLHLLPRDCSTDRIDHWGYFNGDSLPNLPTSTDQAIAFYSHRQPNSSKVLYGSLESITYPTGGVSVFKFEANRYGAYVDATRQNLVSENGVGGGLRVAEIAEYEDTTRTRMLSRRRFSYNFPNGTSSGQLYMKPRYYWPSWVANVKGENATKIITTFRANSILSLQSLYGPCVGYSRVVETLDDGAKTVSEFANIYEQSIHDELNVTPGINTAAPSPYDKYTEMGARRGKLTAMTQYDKSGNKVRSSHFAYDISKSAADDYAANLRVHYNNFPASLSIYHAMAGGHFIYYPGRIYKLYCGVCDLTQQIDTVFMANGPSVTVTNYARRNDSVPLSSPYTHTVDVRVTDSVTTIMGGHQQRETRLWNFNSNDIVTRQLATQDFVITPTETTTSYDGHTNGISRTTHQLISVNNVNHAAPKQELAIYPSGEVDTLVTYHGYTPTGVLKSYTKRGEPKMFLHWCVNDCFLAARYDGGSDGLNFLKNNEQMIFNRFGFINKLRGFSYYFDPSWEAYAYEPLFGVSAIIHSNGAVTYYNYDSMGRLKTVKGNEGQVLQEFEYNYKNK